MSRRGAPFPNSDRRRSAQARGSRLPPPFAGPRPARDSGRSLQPAQEFKFGTLVKRGRAQDMQTVLGRVVAATGRQDLRHGLQGPDADKTVSTMNRPDWINWESTLNYVMQRQKLVCLGGILACACDICGLPVTAMGGSIDHKIGWRDYLGSFARDGKLAWWIAKAVYSDPENLAFVHSRCNSQNFQQALIVSRGMAKKKALAYRCS